MPTRYISSKTAQLYTAPTGGAHSMILIFGDEVEVTGPADGARFPAIYRGRPGFVSAAQLGDTPALELYFIDVGQGDSTFIVTPARKTILIDGGLNWRALGFLAWKYRLDQPGPPIDIDLLVLSHADSDHLDGLAPIVGHPRIRVRQVIHSGVAVCAEGAYTTTLGQLDQGGDYLITRHSSLHELDGLRLDARFAAWRNAIAAEGCGYRAVDSTTGALIIGDPSVRLEVLGPRLDQLNGGPALRWFGNSAHTINGHSVVLRLTCGAVSVLLPGDLNRDGAEYLMVDQALVRSLDAHVLKAPHHGSHEFYPPLLEAIRPQISVISSGDDVDHGHPRAVFVGAIGHYSRSAEPLVFSTEIAANFAEAGDPPGPDTPVAPEPGNLATLDANARARLLFKRRLHGMINVRSDGRQLYAARRVAASYKWEAYGPIRPAVRASQL
jgi:beta-lactamase superfamily II metal-dependent hydrolase